MASLHLKLDPEIQLPPGSISGALLARLTEGVTEDELVEAWPDGLPT